jgi:inorganic pyrophosphatase
MLSIQEEVEINTVRFRNKRMRFDRMLFSSMMYPADYSLFLKHWHLDGDPLDVLVLVNEPTFPGV